jgi:hypothetical protein
MLTLLLLILCIIDTIRLPKLLRLTSSQYPLIDKDEFQNWKETEIKGMKTFLFITWPFIFIDVTSEILTLTGNMMKKTSFQIIGVTFVLWVIVFFITSRFSRKAKQLRKELGIKQPRKNS